MVHILSEHPSVLNQYIGEVRDAGIQKDPLRFRRNIERLGEIFAIEISRSLSYTETEVTTPLGIAVVPLLDEYPVLATILRAGLPFHQGFLNIFDRSENAFISTYRKTHKDGTFSMNVEYSSIPETEGKVLILGDPMLATGSSMIYAYKELIAHGKPKHVHFVTIVASMEGLNQLKMNIPKKNTDIWVGAVDEELTAQSYIVPGLGDAGDLSYGRKI
jgi:uracil phosphoribosyltransferase